MRELPALDLVTDRAGVVVQERPVVSLSAWLADALRGIVESYRVLQVMTPRTTRITPAVRSMLPPGSSRWVVREPSGDEFYDGLSGSVLLWDGEQFVPANDDDGLPVRSATFGQEQPGLGAQLLVHLRVRHAAAAATMLGAACATLAEGLTGAEPSGWGTAEPVTQPWREADLTAFARGRAPKSTWLTVSGAAGDDTRPLLGTIEVRRVPSGVDEYVAVYVGFAPEEKLPIGALPQIVDDLAGRFTLVSFLAQLLPGRRDLTFAPYWTGFPRPLGVAVGDEAVAPAGLGSALDPPGDDVRAVGVGSPASPGVYYPLRGEQDDNGWYRYRRVMSHLGVPNEVFQPEGSPEAS